MLRTLTASLTVLSMMACDDDFGFRPNAEPPPTPAARPPEVVENTDFITQVTTPEVDVIFIVDNSCSMADNQNQLATNFPAFMDFFEGSGLDYHIGAISTDVINQIEAGVLQESDGYRYITPLVSDAAAVFDGMARLGSSGANTERGLDAGYTLLELKKNLEANRGFYRNDAAIHGVAVSDEDDQSTINSTQEWIRWYDGLKPELDMRSFSSIVSYTFSPGVTYRAATEAIGGVEFDIDEPSWEVVLERLGIQASGLKREYFLSQQPVVSTIEVSVLRDTGQVQPVEIRFDQAEFDDEGVLLSGEWAYELERNSITFQNFIPDPLDVIKVHYTLLAANQLPVDEEDQTDLKGGN